MQVTAGVKMTNETRKKKMENKETNLDNNWIGSFANCSRRIYWNGKL